MRKLVLLFGGSRGIGKASVARLVADGFNVAYTTTSAATVKEDHLKSYSVDIRDEKAVATIFQVVQSDFNQPIHAVIANAGINVPGKPLAQFSSEDFANLFAVNVTGAFNVLREAAKHVEDGGSILAVTTSLVRRPVPGVGPYTATKAAVEALMRSLAIEVSSRKIRVNMVAPGPVDTDLFRNGKSEEAINKSAALSLFNRVGSPEEIANVISFLLSSQASWIDAQVIQPNGGLV